MEAKTKSSNRLISKEEVKKNNGKQGNRLFIIVNNKVFDITGFNHPAGMFVFDNNLEDKKNGFLQVGHSKKARDLLTSYYIGDLIN